ncbi:MAG TPA: iron-sulfur cluster assembly accessory protein [Myxococcaceae bacterium]|nr:iron-sulfur cluster assembly accessory protein [Myxococcaceae bacterium]
MDTEVVSPIAAPSSPLRLTERAVTQVKTLMKGQGWEGYSLAVRVVPAGCNGLGYDLNLVKEPKEGDLVWEQDGVKVTTDALSGQYLGGTEVDYVSEIQGAGFKFSNPNAKSSCGCGQTFSA